MSSKMCAGVLESRSILVFPCVMHVVMACDKTSKSCNVLVRGKTNLTWHHFNSFASDSTLMQVYAQRAMQLQCSTAEIKIA